MKIAYWYLSLCLIIHRVVPFFGRKGHFLQRKKIDCIFLVLSCGCCWEESFLIMRWDCVVVSILETERKRERDRERENEREWENMRFFLSESRTVGMWCEATLSGVVRSSCWVGRNSCQAFVCCDGVIAVHHLHAIKEFLHFFSLSLSRGAPHPHQPWSGVQVGKPRCFTAAIASPPASWKGSSLFCQ